MKRLLPGMIKIILFLMHNSYKLKKTRVIFRIILLLILTGACSAFAQNEQQNKMHFLFGGDLCFAETYQVKLEKKGKTNILKSYGYDYSLSKIAPLLKKANHVIANLETPLTDITNPIFSESEKYKIHKGDIKENPAALKKFNINVVSLANNHSMDYGEEGLKQTLKILKDSSISVFGAGLNDRDASIPYRFNCKAGEKNFHIIIVGGLNYSEKYDKEYKFYAGKKTAGVNGWTKEKVIEQIKMIRSTDSTAFIVAYPHWFENYVWKTEKETELTHAMIDAGADMVIGHGSHMFQEIELYNNKWIIYSLGNLVFNSPGRYKKRESNPYSFAAMLEVEEKKGKLLMNMRLYPLLSNNLETNYQPRFLLKEEMNEAFELLQSHSINFRQGEGYERGKDEIGFFVNLNIN